LIVDRYASYRGLVRLGLAHAESTLGRTRPFEQIDFPRVQRLVFVCLGNICRSPFGEAVARRRAVSTAGFGLSTTTGAPAFELARKTATRFNLDLDDHRATDFTDFGLTAGDLLIAMEVRHARRLAAMTASHDVQITLLGHWARPRRLHIHDPLEHSEQYFANCFTVIENATEALVAEFLKSR